MSMPTCPSCKHAKGICGKTGVPIRYSTGCTYHEPKPMTNYESLISKNPEELAEFLHDMTLISQEIGLSVEWWEQWLKSPAEVDNG